MKDERRLNAAFHIDLMFVQQHLFFFCGNFGCKIKVNINSSCCFQIWDKFLQIVLFLLLRFDLLLLSDRNE